MSANCLYLGDLVEVDFDWPADLGDRWIGRVVAFENSPEGQLVRVRDEVCDPLGYEEALVSFAAVSFKARDEGHATATGHPSGVSDRKAGSAGRRGDSVASASASVVGPRAELPANATVTVTAGAGGIDAQDWAERVLRMELLWATHHGVEPLLVDVRAGAEAGIESARFEVPRERIRSLYEHEVGVHRLVRRSPYDMQHRRQTSFATVAIEGDEPRAAQVRSYVLDPYELVTDHRTDIRTKDVAAVLDGKLHLLGGKRG